MHITVSCILSDALLSIPFPYTLSDSNTSFRCPTMIRANQDRPLVLGCQQVLAGVALYSRNITYLSCNVGSEKEVVLSNNSLRNVLPPSESGHLSVGASNNGGSGVAAKANTASFKETLPSPTYGERCYR